MNFHKASNAVFKYIVVTDMTYRDPSEPGTKLAKVRSRDETQGTFP